MYLNFKADAGILEGIEASTQLHVLMVRKIQHQMPEIMVNDEVMARHVMYDVPTGCRLTSCIYKY